jgi:aminomethyltransferase
MTQSSPPALKRTSLSTRHRAHGATLGTYAGWEMPVVYGGVTSEHLAVRTCAGLFDVSHMGQIEVAGKRALEAVQWVTSNDVSRLKPGQVHYSGLMTPLGTFVDDCTVYRLAESHFMLVVNAANTARDVAWIAEQTRPFDGVAVLDTSARYALLALQGPMARTILQRIVNFDLGDVRYYWFAPGEIASVRGTVSRTGYTGEDGYELFLPPAQASRVWDALLEEGRSDGLVPAGLWARDTLRLEAAMRLHGQDIDESTSVLEADLEWIVAWGKGPFLGRDVLAAQKAAGLTRRLVGFEMADHAIARSGYTCTFAGRAIGQVTSGTLPPFVKKPLGLAYVAIDAAQPGTEFIIDIRGREARATVVPLPFYKRPRG